MDAVIRTRIVKVGNSLLIRIPKLLLEQSGIDTEVEIEVRKDHLILRPASCVRAGWNEAFAKMAELKDDVLLDNVDTTNWDQLEWEW
ncbi:transcriptional regulator/antitoxin, MazE [Calothrix sp. NIES-4071]|nr:transcriptional regulator/antitoxin, MazE [Calothrix sp. NIES-4071]BAZ63106.1 transcriptional regulator/antitoxin, MazE [Calothrix sp. NIES-4105]